MDTRLISILFIITALAITSTQGKKKRKSTKDVLNESTREMLEKRIGPHKSGKVKMALLKIDNASKAKQRKKHKSSVEIIPLGMRQQPKKRGRQNSDKNRKSNLRHRRRKRKKSNKGKIKVRL